MGSDVMLYPWGGAPANYQVVEVKLAGEDYQECQTPILPANPDRGFWGLISVDKDIESLRFHQNFNGYSYGVLLDNFVYGPTADTPVFSPDGGEIAVPTSVSVTCATSGATIRYTTDGSDPTDTNGTVIASGSSVVVAPGVTLKAKAWASGLLPSSIKSATYMLPTYGRPSGIPQGTATVDGDLSEWTGAVWAPLDQNYDLTAPDVLQAFYAARWSANKVYVAVKVEDSAPFFTSTYTAWDARDAAEIFIHTTGTAANNDYSADQAAAQHYMLGGP